MHEYFAKRVAYVGASALLKLQDNSTATVEEVGRGQSKLNLSFFFFFCLYYFLATNGGLVMTWRCFWNQIERFHKKVIFLHNRSVTENFFFLSLLVFVTWLVFVSSEKKFPFYLCPIGNTFPKLEGALLLCIHTPINLFAGT